MKYTKGKWEKGSFDDEPFARSLLSIYREDGEAIVMALTPRLMPFEVAEANAHLIVASPLLYEALRMAQTYIARAEIRKGTLDRTRLEDDIVKALSKAEGKNAQI